MCTRKLVSYQVFIWFWLIVCATIVSIFKCVPLFFSRNVLFLIYNHAQLKRAMNFQHLSDQYYHIRKHWPLVDSRSRLYLAKHALIVCRDCSVRKSVMYFQSHCIHTQNYHWYFSGKDDTSSSISIVCGHGMFVLIVNQKSSKVVVW